MPWRISEVLAEAIHDLLALGPKVVTAASIACVGAAMVTTTPIFEVRETLESTDELVRQGWATTEISAERSGAVDSASCAALKGIEGVADVYGVRRIGPQRIVQFGGRTVMVHEIFLSDATMAQEVAVGGVPSRAKVAWVGDDIVQQRSSCRKPCRRIRPTCSGKLPERVWNSCASRKSHHPAAVEYCGKQNRPVLRPGSTFVSR
jgi:hypothetical protein